MKLKGAITISRPEGTGPEYISLKIKDRISSCCFVEIEIPLADFTKALTGLAYVEGDMEVRGLDKVGKQMEHKKISFPLSEDAKYDYKNRTKEATEKAERICEEEGLGFILSDSFNSRGSFFSEDGKEWAACTVRRWV